MAQGTTRPHGSSGEYISHINAVRMRITGFGVFNMKFWSLDDIYSQDLVPFDLQSATNREPTRLANFKEQRAALEFSTDDIDEYFRINRIIIFTKALWSGYPG